MDIQSHYNQITDIWQFIKKHLSNIPKTEDEWGAFVDEEIAISKKHGECQYIIDLLFATEKEVSRISKC